MGKGNVKNINYTNEYLNKYMNDDDYLVDDIGEGITIRFNRIENYDTSEIRRLILVENAVTNYSGGIDSLITRLEYEINKIVKTKSLDERRLEQLLKDLSFYLRDVSCHLRR